MQSVDQTRILALLQQGERANRQAEQYLEAIVHSEGDLPGVQFRRVDDGTLDFIVQAHHIELIARYGHVVKNKNDADSVSGIFNLYRIDQYLRLGSSAVVIGKVEIDASGKVDIDGDLITTLTDPMRMSDNIALLRGDLIHKVQEYIRSK